MTTNFYAPPSAIRSGRVVLPDDEARHVRSVLRGQEGDEIVVVDGEGGWYRVRIDHLARQQVVGTVLETRHGVGEPDVDVTIGMGVLTKRSRFETFVEKAVELGVRRIVPLRTRHTERDDVRTDRLRNVMIAALKQCRRTRLPTLLPPKSLPSLLELETTGLRVLCHGSEEGEPLFRVLNERAVADEVLLLIGPEGGFSAEEVQHATDAGCIPVSLGQRRLRAETAGIVAVNGVMLRAQADVQSE